MASTILSDSNKSPAQEEEEQRTAMLAKLDMVSVLDGKEIFDAVTQAFPTTLGKAVSKKEREEMQLRDPNLVYGEITFEAFGTVFEKIKKVYGKPNVGSSGASGFMQSPGGIFYDLGSGTGKPVIAAAILHNFDICYGIELMEGLYSVSLDMLNTFNTKGKARLATRSQDTHVQMIQGDFLKMRTKDWRDADVLFLNSTCYDEAMMAKIGTFAAGLKIGAFVISLTKRIPSSDFKVLEYEMYRMSWGEATIFIHQKVTEGNDDAEDSEEEDDEDNEDAAPNQAKSDS